MENYEVKLKEFKEHLQKIEYINNAVSLAYWDMRVSIPKKGIPYRGQLIGYLSSEAYKLQTSDTMKSYIDYFETLQDLDDVTKAMVANAKRGYERTKKIPEDRYREYVVLTSDAEAAWEDAKEKSNFSIFKPYLEKIVGFQKEFADYWGYKNNRYDALLDDYERGITVEIIDEVFAEVRNAIVSLLNRIKDNGTVINTEFLKRNFPKKDQEDFGVYVLKAIGYDFDAGRLDESVHPFTVDLNNKDVRITTRYFENDFRGALFGSIHEGGHALYEQDIPDDLQGTLLGGGTSMGIHESQSRFYENILGRSKEFWMHFYPEAQRRFDQFKDISFEDFYRGINSVEPSLIRVEADELTYSLHIIIRYEIEKALINGEVEVKDLPQLWNEKYKDYLGIEPKNDAQGVLQDVHWSGGSFGYFPSYALGNLYGAQFLNTMLKDIPSFYKDVEQGKLAGIHSWLKENIHKHGSVYTPSELIYKVTGEGLKAQYFIDYLEKKYSEIYSLR
jgi:carboxypeptidase Taq